MAPPPYFPSRMPAIAYDLPDPASPSPSADAGPFIHSPMILVLTFRTPLTPPFFLLPLHQFLTRRI